MTVLPFIKFLVSGNNVHFEEVSKKNLAHHRMEIAYKLSLIIFLWLKKDYDHMLYMSLSNLKVWNIGLYCLYVNNINSLIEIKAQFRFPYSTPSEGMTLEVKLVYHAVFRNRVQDLDVESNKPEAKMGGPELVLEPKIGKNF